MSRFSFFFFQVKKDIFGFLFWLVLFTLFRILFLSAHLEELEAASFTDILLCLWYGLRISLKTAGAIALVPFLFSTMAQTVWARWPGRLLRQFWQGFCFFLFTFLFIGRFVYYDIFHAAYNIMIINGLFDDWNAIIRTAIDEYHALYLLPLPILLSLLIFFIWRRLDRDIVYHEYETSPSRKLWYIGIFCLCFPALFIFLRFGGAFTYHHSINWANAGRLPLSLLNETILDDAQALYRTYAAYTLMQEKTAVPLAPAALRQAIIELQGNPDADSIDAAFSRRVGSPIMEHPPQHIYLILGESYGLWPFLPVYRPMGLAAEGVSFMESNRGASVPTSLAQGTGTMPAVNGFLTGLPDAGLYPNYMKVSYHEPYRTGIGYVMKQLGYKTIFWYGGFGEWQSVRHFALSQHFDAFYGAEDITNTTESAWGMPDKELFEAISAYSKEHAGEKTFHFILTTTNHPPYTLDIDAEGYPRKQVQQAIPPSVPKKDAVVTELGHFWYADHVMGAFVRDMEAAIPDSFFIITGDHSERFTFDRAVDIRTRSAIPLIFYGAGVQPDWFPASKVSMPIQIIPTLAELIAPPGFLYYAMVPSLFDPAYHTAFNHRLWAHDGEIGELSHAPADYRSYVEAARAVAAQRIAFGDALP